MDQVYLWILAYGRTEMKAGTGVCRIRGCGVKYGTIVDQASGQKNIGTISIYDVIITYLESKVNTH
jgi:hypothetical protein